MAQVAASYQLRDYQHQWIKDIWDSWERGHRRVLAQLPTGSGKTVCLAHIAAQFFLHNQQVLVIAHRIELISQAAEKLESVLGQPVGIIKARCRAHPERLVQLASIQTLAQRELQKLPLNIGLLVVDEAHHASAFSYRRILEHYQSAKILGVTATPQRIDGQGFVDLFDDLVIGASTGQLIGQGYLSKFRLFATNQTISTLGVETLRGDFRASSLAVAVTSQIGVEQIYQNYLKYARNLRTVIFAASVEHSRALAAFFSRQGIHAEHLDGSIPTVERVAIVQRFQTGATQVITNYEILTEGYDCPDIECVFCVRPTQSSTLWLQMIGRVLRTHPLKPMAVIIDVTDNWFQHGLPDERRQWSLQPKVSGSLPTIRLIQCSACTHVFQPQPQELEIITGEVGEDGLLIQHHQATCPSCRHIVLFTTKETTSSKTTSISPIRLKHSLSLNISEIDLRVCGKNIEQVYDLMYQQWLQNQPPAKIYKAIFMSFIENISEFTLGDWREIVKMAEPGQPGITKKAWELYQEALSRHHNRLLALNFIAQRNSNNQNRPTPKKLTPTPPSQNRGNHIHSCWQEQSSSPGFTKKLGNSYFQKKYASQWEQSLANCSTLTADFLRNHAGLFHVETTPKYVNISLEIRDIPSLKLNLNKIFDSQEIQSAFSLGFDKFAKVTLRLTSQQNS